MTLLSRFRFWRMGRALRTYERLLQRERDDYRRRMDLERTDALRGEGTDR